MSAKRLSKGEKKVVDAWNGSVKETAAACNMSYGYVQRVVRFSYIVKLIQQREDELREADNKPLIADRTERQEFWSSVARGEPQVVKVVETQDEAGNKVITEVKEVPSMKDRLRAAELLGRSNADFTDRVHVLDADKGIRKEITDEMPQAEATNIYMSQLKSGNA